MPDHVKETWHLSKNVPIAIIMTLLVQSVSVIWYFSGLENRVMNNATNVAENKLDIEHGNSVEPRLVRVETDISYIRRSVDDNKIKLEKLDDKLTVILRETRSPR